MHAFILQDWNTIRGAVGVSTVIQSEDNWLDLTPYQDVVFWVDCRAVTGTTVQIQFQTSPTKDDSLFTPIIVAQTFTTSLQTYQVILSKLTGTGNSGVPLARYLRWVVSSSASGTWDSTFRVLVAANSPGM